MLLALLSGLGEGSVRAETLAQLWAKVAAAHPKIQGAQAQVELARSREAQARALFYPRIGVQYDFARSRNESLRISDPQTTQQADAVLRVNLFNGFADVARKASALKELQASQNDLEDAAEDLALALTEQYVGVVTLSRQTANARRLVDDLGILLETVRDSVRLGRNPQSDLIQATTKVLEARSNLSDAQGRLDAARARLEALVGTPVDTLSTPEFEEQIFSRLPRQLLDQARESSPQLRAARARALQASEEAGVVKGDLYPKINLEGRKNIQRDGPAELVSGLEREALVQFTYEYALGRTPYHRVGEARARQLAAEAFVREIEIDLAGRIGEARALMLEYAALAPQLQDRQRAAAGVFEAYRWQFNAGRRSLLDLITVREDQYVSAEAVTANQRDRMLVTARLYRLLGQLRPRIEEARAAEDPISSNDRTDAAQPASGSDAAHELPLKMDRSLRTR